MVHLKIGHYIIAADGEGIKPRQGKNEHHVDKDRKRVFERAIRGALLLR